MLVCLGASHRTATFELLERLATGLENAVAPAAARGRVTLATCNRYELYLDVDDATDPASLLEDVADAAGVDVEELRHGMRVITGSRVSAHLFAVASGLDSMVFGEREITGQVRRALADAQRTRTATPPLERLFQGATATSREVRAISGISEGGQSIVQLALDLASNRVGDWRSARVLVIGSGSHARALCGALVERGVPSMTAWSPSGRTLPHPAVRMVADADLNRELGAADLIITSTNGQALTTTRLALARGTTAGTTLVVDLGMPANVDPAVAELPGVELLDLPTIGLHAPVPELQASARAHDLVESAAGAFEASAAAGPVITELRQHVMRLLDSELARMQARPGTSSETAEATERALRHFAGVLVHGPTTRAHTLAAEGRLEEVVAAVETLFGLRVGEPANDAAEDDDAARLASARQARSATA
ncbi:MAG TPA: glutamyl-tRNA reductase [Actinotalea caeni]|uniref:glutamyl-tRNA reductase n=1 Tax=Actinotalea caeni TaxID=1348467 RepID=UPI002B4AF749|nr:glutamyl-tRNA reductase [Actinotalea caeni]HLV55389.1 glutamyl-tRNA reductase [Actinotalea caeni]